jgi:ribose-phosphate pyrophosphokinase
VNGLAGAEVDPLRDHACELDKIKVLSIAPLLAKAIKSIHEETSVSSLFV